MKTGFRLVKTKYGFKIKKRSFIFWKWLKVINENQKHDLKTQFKYNFKWTYFSSDSIEFIVTNKSELLDILRESYLREKLKNEFK